MVVWMWLIIAAVVLGVGVALGSMDRRSRRRGHVLRTSANMSESPLDAFATRASSTTPAAG